MWYFVFVVWVALVAGIFWVHGRRRKKSEGLRAREIDALITNAKGGLSPAIAAAPAIAPAAAMANAAGSRAAVTPAVAYSRKARLLEQRDALLYLLLRTGLPDHEVFHGLTLAEVIEPADAVRGYERDQILRRLAQTRLDFVVCNKRLEIVAVVMFQSGSQADDATGGILAAAGVRRVLIDPLAMPRHQQLRGLVCADAPAPAV